MCGAYMYPVNIERTPRIVAEPHTARIEHGNITVEELRAIVGEAPFSMTEEERGGYSLDWMTYRTESPEEMARRIEKQEAYNAEHYRRKAIWNAAHRPPPGE